MEGILFYNINYLLFDGIKECNPNLTDLLNRIVKTNKLNFMHYFDIKSHICLWKCDYEINQRNLLLITNEFTNITNVTNYK